MAVWMLPAAMAAGQAISGMLGAQAATKANKDALKKAAEAFEANKAYFENIGIPTKEAQRMILEQYELPPEFAPVLEETVSLGTTGVSKVSRDAGLNKIRMDALAKLQNISDTNGMDIQAQVGTDQALQQAAELEQGQRQAAELGMQRRGIAGGGAELALREQAIQNASNQARSVAQQQAVAANQRALEALSQGTNLAGNLSQEDIALQMEKAKAQDIIDRFNADAKMSTNARNTAIKNDAAMLNLKNQMAISGANTDTRNAMVKRDADYAQSNFDNQMKRASGAMGQTAGMVDNIYKGGAQAAATNSAPYIAAANAAPAVADKLSAYLYPEKYDPKTGQKIKNFDPQTGKEILD